MNRYDPSDFENELYRWPYPSEITTDTVAYDAYWNSVFNLVGLLYLFNIKSTIEVYYDYSYNEYLARMGKRQP